MELEQKLSQREGKYQLELQDLHWSYQNEIREKDENIEFLRNRVDQIMNDLQKEIKDRDNIINSKVMMVKR